MAMIYKQKGVVLIISLVFLASLTAVAAALMLNTTADIKMSGASEQKLIATQAALSAVDETVSIQLTGARNMFAQQLFPQTVNTVVAPVTRSQIINPNAPLLEADCPHTRLASSNDLIRCHILSINVNNNYGRGNSSNINIDTGIAQQVLSTGN